MPFAGMWMDLEIIILNEVRPRKTNVYDSTYMWNLKKKMTHELIYKTEIISNHRKQTYGYQRGKEGRDKLRIWE